MVSVYALGSAWPMTLRTVLVECPNCAGHALRVRKEGDRWLATLAHRVSCPGCEELVTLPEDAKAGDVIACCGRRYRLTFEYGAFAAEEL